MGKREVRPIDDHSRVRLRLLEEGDLPLTLGWRNQDHIRKWFFYAEVLTFDQHQAWFQKYQTRDNDYVFIIEDISSGCRPVGQIAIYNIDWEKGRGEFGRLMIGDPEAAGKGFARPATQLVLSVAFGALGLEEVYLEVFANNERAIAVYQKCGFVVDEQKDNVLHMTCRPPGPSL